MRYALPVAAGALGAFVFVLLVQVYHITYRYLRTRAQGLYIDMREMERRVRRYDRENPR